jgi:ribosome biogenesis protein Tsr3
MMRQDDPFKCTAAKLVKFRLVEPVRTIRSNWIVLNPYATDYLLKSDAMIADCICAIDCSWEKADGEFKPRQLFKTGQAVQRRGPGRGVVHTEPKRPGGRIDGQVQVGSHIS